MEKFAHAQETKRRLRLNWTLVLFLANVLFTVSTTAYLTSFHRFVTNPRSSSLNGTSFKIHPGLGESEFFYSLVLNSYYTSACFATMLTGFLVSCVPYSYLFITAVGSHVLGYTLYGVATQGWHLIVSQMLAGYFIGSQFTVCYSYASESSVVYAEAIREKEGKIEKEYKIRLRDSLYTLISVAQVLGYFVGPGVAVVFVHLPIDPFRSIAWFNVAYGVVLLVLLVFLFRKESGCHKFSKCNYKSCQGSRPGIVQVFILISMFLFAVIDVFKWGFPETLLNPILSDSFGLSLSVTAYFYVGIGVPQLFGCLLLLLLQKFKLRNNILLLIGMFMTTIAYLVLADWQTIPYDPCTKHSPFHHPEIVQNMNFSANQTNQLSYDQNISTESNVLAPVFSFIIRVHSSVKMQYTDDRPPQVVSLPYFTSLTCTLEPKCQCTHANNYNVFEDQLCVNYMITTKNIHGTLPKSSQYLCSSDALLQSVCFNLSVSEGAASLNDINGGQDLAQMQELQVLSDSTYELASNSCESADIPGVQCNWIPFSTITHTKCSDCPPICRAKERTLNFVQFLIGLSLLMASFHLTFVPLMAVATNNAPNFNGSQGIVIGGMTTTTLLSQALSPLVVDASYEGIQKRTFLIAALLAVVHLPFIFEVLALFKQFGRSDDVDQNQGSSKS